MHGLLPPTTLAIDAGLIGQLVFVLIALLAWILREAAERKAASREDRASAEEDGAPRPPSALERLAGFLADPDEADEADAVAKRVAERARARRKAHPEEYVEAPAAPTPPPLEPAPVQSLVNLHDGGHGTITDVWTTGATTGRPGRGSRARRRLGLEPGLARTSARRAILWAEVLGPPRSQSRGRARGVPPAAHRR